jgi:DNA modification methylase
MTAPRKVVIGSAELWLGDCRNVIPTLSGVDIVVTSPPYNTLPTSSKASGLHAERKNGINKWMENAATGYSDNMPEEDYQVWLNGILLLAAKVTDGLIWVNHKIRYRDGEAIHPVRMIQMPIYAEVIWNRSLSMALNCKRFAPSHEGFWAFGTTHYWDDKNNALMSVWTVPFAQRDAWNNHPCPYPERVIRPIIESSAPPRGTILDCFMGSGTTGATCAHLGRKFIGIEIEERYFDIACRRIEEAQKQSDLFIRQPTAPVAKTGELFE